MNDMSLIPQKSNLLLFEETVENDFRNRRRSLDDTELFKFGDDMERGIGKIAVSSMPVVVLEVVIIWMSCDVYVATLPVSMSLFDLLVLHNNWFFAGILDAWT